MAPRRVEESPGAQRRSGLCLNEIPRRQYFVYIVASSSRTIYIGMTNDLERRRYEHKLFKGFTAKYGVDRLVFMEYFSSVYDAIAREKELKGWRRARKFELIEAENPKWLDLSHDWSE